MNETTVRELIANALSWNEAHATLDAAVADVPMELQGRRTEHFPHSLWELLEHIRIAQADLLEFCRNPEYRQPNWPEEYWPATPGPPGEDSWSRSVRQVLADRAALRDLALDPGVDLTAAIPHGRGQTYLRELLLAIDHTSYHVGQMVALRKALESWG